MTNEDQSRRELAQFLRTRRERINPDQVGLPAGPRRRTTGLRREEVAVLAGLSPTWYTYLEQGRKIRPSSEVLDSLARVLLLSEDERQHLHMLAHGQVPNPAPLLEGKPLDDLVRDLVAVTGASPYPVYALDLRSDCIAWNTAAAEWYTDWGALPVLRRNMIWWMFCDPEARVRLADWEDDARDIVARFRTVTAKLPNDPRLDAIVAEVGRRSPEFRDWWTSHDVRGHRVRPRTLVHPRIGRRAMNLMVVHPAVSSEILIAYHLPASADDAL